MSLIDQKPCNAARDFAVHEEHDNADGYCPGWTYEQDIHRMVSELHDGVLKVVAAVTEMQNSKGGMMGVMMKMMSGK